MYIRSLPLEHVIIVEFDDRNRNSGGKCGTRLLVYYTSICGGWYVPTDQ